MSAPFTWVPFDEPGSSTDQPPPGCETRTACRCETPGSAGGPVRSISGSSPRETLRRPIRASLPDSPNRRSGQYAGNSSALASGPPAATTRSKYARSAVTTAVQPDLPDSVAGWAGAAETGAVGPGETGLAARPDWKSKPHTSQNWPLRSVPHCGHCPPGAGTPGAGTPGAGTPGAG